MPGNAGLKDQVLALKWVKQYISHFNGDVNNITVFGESAGGCSTHYMMCTEQTRGLFHKAIPMSGTLHNYWSNTPPADFAYRLAKAHGYEGENIDRLVLEHLRGVAPHQLVNHSLLTAEDRRNGLIYAFGPTVEPYIMPDCVAPKRQLEMASEAWSNELPVMMGGVSFEGLFMYPALKANLKGLDTLPQDPLRIIPYEVLLLNTKQQNLEFSNKLIKLYFGDARPSSEHIMNFLDVSLKHFLVPCTLFKMGKGYNSVLRMYVIVSMRHLRPLVLVGHSRLKQSIFHILLNKFLLLSVLFL